jgi:hypothetical protein
MFTKDSLRKCQVLKKVTKRGMFRCLKPATVILVWNTPDGNPLMLCPDCARELVKEIVDSAPGGERDVDVFLARRGRR